MTWKQLLTIKAYTNPRHRDAVDCLMAQGLIPTPENLPELTGKPCTCEPRPSSDD